MATTVSLARVPASFIESASTASSWSPSTTLPSWSTARTRSASPSTREADVGVVLEHRGADGVEVGGAAAVVDVQAVGGRRGSRSPSRRRPPVPGARHRSAAPSAQSSTTVRPGERVVDRAAPGGRRTPRRRSGTAVTRPTAPPVGRSNSSTQATLDGRLDRVVELEAAAGEELDAVVGHRVVRRGQDDTEVRPERAREEGDARRRQHAEQQHVDARGRQTGHDRRLEELSRRCGCRGRRRPAGGAPRTRRGRRARGRRPRTGPGPGRR